MKSFIQNDGLFELEIPISWHYRIENARVHTFENFKKGGSHAFQISLINASDSKIKEKFGKMVSNALLAKFTSKDVYYYQNVKDKGFITKVWFSFLSDNIVTFTYTFRQSEDFLPREYNDVINAIETFELIDADKRKSKLNIYRFTLFLKGIAATNAILDNAVGNKAFIEATCILANQIDALLRTGIVLKEQLISGNSNIDEQWIYQGANDKRKSEKDIYKKAKQLGVITDEIFRRLYDLYEERNRVVHRFIISEITLVIVEQIASRYYVLRQAINQIIYSIEEEQIERQIGMTQKNDAENKFENMDDWVNEKIGTISYFEQKKRRFPPLNKEKSNLIVKKL